MGLPNEQPVGAIPSENRGKFCELVEDLWTQTGEYLLKPEDIERRAKGFHRLLGDYFFRPETDYVLVCVARLRGERRDAIKADEILRVAEKVYGAPISMWQYPDAGGSPEVWSTRENDWIPLSQALERLWNAEHADSEMNTNEQWQADFERRRPELLKAIYGEGV